MDDPLLASFTLRAPQFDMAEGMVFQFVAPPRQLLSCVEASNADVFFMAITPSVGSKSPADDKKGSLDAALVKNIGQARSRMTTLAAEKDIGSRAVVKGKGNELAGLYSRAWTRRCGVAGSSVAVRAAVAKTSAEHAESYTCQQQFKRAHWSCHTK